MYPGQPGSGSGCLGKKKSPRLLCEVADSVSREGLVKYISDCFADASFIVASAVWGGGGQFFQEKPDGFRYAVFFNQVSCCEVKTFVVINP